MKHHEDDHDRGLSHDLQTMRAALRTRRGVLRLLAGASLLPFVGCLASGEGGDDGEDQDSGSGSNGGGADAGTDESCSAIPQETAGPYPGDGSNGANALLLAGIARSDIRASVASASGTAQGVLLTVKLTLVDTEASCAPLSGYAVYLWHCDRDGAYSMYAGSALNENYLRGVQQTEHEHRHLRALPQILENVEPVGAGQHQIEDHQLEVELVGRDAPALLPPADLVAGARQPRHQLRAELGIVFDQEDSFCHGVQRRAQQRIPSSLSGWP
jgi:hypothetical protein